MIYKFKLNYLRYLVATMCVIGGDDGGAGCRLYTI